MVRGQEAAGRDEVCVPCAFCPGLAHRFPSGDGTLSVMDVRSKKLEPVAQSEDQEDELLSVLPIKGYVTPLQVCTLLTRSRTVVRKR